jgi:hypothetical protein
MSASTTPVFHRYYDQVEQKPTFYLDAGAAELARQGAPVPGWADVETVAVPVIARPSQPPAERMPEQVCPVTGGGSRGGAVLPRPRVRPAVPPTAGHGATRDTAASRWRWPFRQRPATAVSERADR